ncbi:hypothetical protein E4656_04885 [Natronospirillum operosum]|uniref:Protein BatD n=1 Tax=Natronospirillum operosum TaxID=2759953 RepID=A0A4Z0WGS2_9GAMM|nr:hypothetical protein E4656_04885 [Natronospirillum operosum]
MVSPATVHPNLGRPACLWSVLMVLSLLLGLYLTVIPATAQTTDALASVNRTTVVEGSTLTLRVRTRVDNHELNLAPLLRDFEVIDQRSSTNNPALHEALGRDFQEWEITLRPRQTGHLTIPALQVGTARTHPIEITVLAVSPEQRAVMDRNVELDVAVSNRRPYVGESIRVTLTLYYNVSVNGAFADVTPEDSEWTALGDALTGETQRAGNTYSYTRFHYLYTPLSPGERELPTFRFEGDYRTHSLAPRQPLRDVRSDPVALEVRPVPAEFPGNHAWLPARDLTLTQTWSGVTDNPQVGDQFTRHTRVQATGPDGARLPRPAEADSLPASVRRYEGSARAEENLDAEQRVSTRHDEVAYLLRQPGSLELPALRIPWWDLDTDSLRWAEAPGRSLDIAPGPLQPTPDLVEPEPAAEVADDAGPGLTSRIIMAAAGFLVALALGWLLHRSGRRLWQRIAHWWARRSANPDRPSRPARASETKAEPRVRTARKTAAGASAKQPRRARRPSAAPAWIQAVRQATDQQDWARLLGLLAEHRDQTGWPDLERMARISGQQEVPTLVRDTQAMQYGRPEQQPDPVALGERWLRCLDQWPQAGPGQTDNAGPDRLYPD